jgi:hypothetical protein
MKGRFSYLVAAALVVGLSTSCASVRLASAHQRFGSQKEHFAGEIPRNPEIGYNSMDQLYRLIIYDETRKTNYFLDDNGKAEIYDGKKVEIEGMLERKNTDIRFDSINAIN